MIEDMAFLNGECFSWTYLF